MKREIGTKTCGKGGELLVYIWLLDTFTTFDGVIFSLDFVRNGLNTQAYC